MPEYLVRLAQAHETFRKVELQALADVAGVGLNFVKYEEDVGTISFHASHICQYCNSVESPAYDFIYHVHYT